MVDDATYPLRGTNGRLVDHHAAQPLLTQLGKYPALLGLPNPDAPQGLAVWVRTLQNWLRKKEFQLSHGHLGPQVLSQPFVDIDIQAAWHHARQIAGGHAIPPEPAKPLSIGAAINALDALVNWAAAADSLTAPLSDGGGACSREVARPQSPARAMSEPESFLDSSPERQAKRAAFQELKQCADRLSAASEQLLDGGGGRTWKTD